ncbi:MAG: YlbF family regulator [Clostridia bacterium]|nr:YlbF family regulator [Clostridia bacterium]
MDYSSTYKLAQDIRDSEEYTTYHELKKTVMEDETTAALIKEYRKLQMTIQMTAMSGQQADSEDMQRFSGISTLLFSKPEVSQFLLAEMRLQQALADIFKIVTEAADVDVSIPGLEG